MNDSASKARLPAIAMSQLIRATESPASLSDILASGRFAVTAEIAPPVSASASDFERKLDAVRGTVDAVNVTDAASARVHMSSLAAAAILRMNGIEPILQLTCRDRNRIALQSDLLGAAALGIRNVLALGGDPVEAGDEADARPVYDLSTKQLLAAMHRMSHDGETLTGRRIETPPDFYPGAAALVMEPGNARDPEVLTSKCEAGARFVQTQFCFDAARLERYMAWLGEHGLSSKMHFLIGVGPLRSARSAQWMRDKLFGTAMPDEIVSRMQQAKDEVREGIRICAELIDIYRQIPGVAGVHLMAPRNLDAIPDVLEAVRIQWACDRR